MSDILLSVYMCSFHFAYAVFPHILLLIFCLFFIIFPFYRLEHIWLLSTTFYFFSFFFLKSYHAYLTIQQSLKFINMLCHLQKLQKAHMYTMYLRTLTFWSLFSWLIHMLTLPIILFFHFLLLKLNLYGFVVIICLDLH